jgi:transcriptional regulator with XRE-family HTH domain
MKEKNITYRELSDCLGFKSTGTVWKWVHGTCHMKAKYITQLSEIFQIPVESFFIDAISTQTPCNGGDCNEL